MEARLDFVLALREYRWLLDRGYPDKAARNLVGDRRRLSAEERILLFRGMAKAEDSARRRSRLGRPEEGACLLLDAYNLAFTLVHYFIGKPCFISSDGLLRDAGANYGRLAREELLGRAFRELAAFLARLRPGSMEAWLDAPVSRSAAHAALLREAFREAGLGEARVELARSADGAIAARLEGLGREGERGGGPEGAVFVLSSDSVLADRAPRIFDLARTLLEESYAASFLDLGALLGEGPETGDGLG